MSEPMLTVTYEASLGECRGWAEMESAGTTLNSVIARAHANAYRKWEQENQRYVTAVGLGYGGLATWVVRGRTEPGTVVARFYGLDSQARATEYAEWKNAQEAGE